MDYTRNAQRRKRGIEYLTEDMMMGERDLEAEVKEKDEIIMSLRLNEHLLNDKLEVSRRNMSKQLERITALENENEQLERNLYNCRLNKNIISEKLKLWQDVHKEYNIYSIKGFEELLNKLKEKNEQLRKENVFLAKQRTYWKSKCAEWMGVKEENLSVRCVNMNEKRFKMLEDSNGLFSIFDNEDPEDEPLIYGARFGTEKIVDLLNEQQSIIRRDEMSIKTMMSNMKKLEEENEDLREVNKENQRLHEENVKQCERWRSLYELKDSEVTARVDTLNRVCEYYLSESRFKGDTDPNEAVKEVIKEILNTPIYEE